MRRFLLLVVLLTATISRITAQSQAVNSGATLPASCLTGSVYITTTTPGMSVCSAPNTWTAVPFGGTTIPAGLISVIASGTCPTGWTESSTLNGVMLRGTVAASGNVGQTGGADTITPTVASLTAAAQTFTGSAATSSAVSAGTPAGTNGTVSITPLLTAIAWPVGVPTFTGSAGTVPAQTFTGSSATTSAVSGGTPAGTINALTTGADSSTTGGVAKAIAQTPTFTGSALGTHTHTVTATGTNGTVSFTPTGTVAWPAGVPTVTGASTTVGAEIFTGSALGTHTHTVTATGTNGTSTVTGTLNNFDNRPAYLNVIFCVKS